MKYIQEALGHGSMQITSDIYTHVSKKIETDAIERFECHTKDIIYRTNQNFNSNTLCYIKLINAFIYEGVYRFSIKII